MEGNPCSSSSGAVNAGCFSHLVSSPKLLRIIPCELCKSPSSLFCAADEAHLCWDCDARIHSANFLVARHPRSLLCPFCGCNSGSASLCPRFRPPPFHLRLCSHCRSRFDAETSKVTVPADGLPLGSVSYCYPWPDQHDEESKVCSNASSDQNDDSCADDVEQEVASSSRDCSKESTLTIQDSDDLKRKRFSPEFFQCWWTEGVGDSEEDDSFRHSADYSSQELSTVLKEDEDLVLNKASKRQRF